MAQLNDQARVLEEWFRLPASRRRYATDAVAFAYRLLQERPDLFSDIESATHDLIVKWLMPHVVRV